MQRQRKRMTLNLNIIENYQAGLMARSNYLSILHHSQM
jgi:hypothetical protein